MTPLYVIDFKRAALPDFFSLSLKDEIYSNFIFIYFVCRSWDSFNRHIFITFFPSILSFIP